MSGQIINGKAIALKIRKEVKKKTNDLKVRGIDPGLAVVMVGDNPASQVYVDLKIKACRQVGIRSETLRLPADASEKQLLQIVDELNDRPDVNGILVQLPLPVQIRKEEVIKAIKPIKDVDGFHPINMGLLMQGNPKFIPCTPLGCLKLIDAYGYKLSGKHAVVIGRSNIVGKPIAALLLQRNATVTICHSFTTNLKEITQQADVLIAAVGKPQVIGAEMIKEGALVLDVGINRLPTGVLQGDVDFTSVREKAALISPVPGGVGPMTIAMLLANTLKAVNYQS